MLSGSIDNLPKSGRRQTESAVGRCLLVVSSQKPSKPVELDGHTECTILVFSILAEKLGTREIVQRLPLPIDTASLLDILCGRFAAITAFRSVIRVAVNREYADDDTIIREGDEVALITPTSGG